MPQLYCPAIFEIDHVVPEKLDGPTTEANRALAYFKCNNHKGPNIAGIDPENGEKAFLSGPRVDLWAKHFVWQSGTLTGLTPVGRATRDALTDHAESIHVHSPTLVVCSVVSCRMDEQAARGTQLYPHRKRGAA